MSDPNENRPGYKMTKVGWIPDDWSVQQLRDLCSNSGQYGANAPALPFDRTLPRYVRITDISDYGDLYPKDKRSITLSDAEKYLLSVGDFLFARTGATVGKTYLHAGSGYPHAFAGYLIRFKPKINSIIPAFLKYFTGSARYWYWVSSTLHAGAQPNINAEEYGLMYTPVPSLPEQKKIADILSTWDRAIGKTRDLIEAKRKQKKGLMQQLLTGNKRLPGFEEEWKPSKLSEYTERIRETAEDPESHDVLSITAKKGFVSQKDKFSKVIAGKHIENYILLRAGEFSYNKGNSYSYPQGCVYQLSEYPVGLVPSVFYSFRVDAAKVTPGFIRHIFSAGLHNHQLHKWVNTGVRNNGLLNLAASDFFNLSFNLPSLEEQTAIAKVLDTADREIQILESKLDALEQQKKGLMQRLLTGQIRVKVDAA